MRIYKFLGKYPRIALLFQVLGHGIIKEGLVVVVQALTSSGPLARDSKGGEVCTIHLSRPEPALD